MPKLQDLDLNIVPEVTFSKLFALYLANIPCNGQSRPFRVRKWITAFGELRAWDLTPAHVSALVECLEATGYKPSTINRKVCDVRSAYSWAIKHHKVPQGFENPARGYQHHEEAIRWVALSDDEIVALQAACKLSRWPKLHTLVLTALHTGACRVVNVKLVRAPQLAAKPSTGSTEV